jgi:hypothetical protein
LLGCLRISLSAEQAQNRRASLDDVGRRGGRGAPCGSAHALTVSGTLLRCSAAAFLKLDDHTEAVNVTPQGHDEELAASAALHDAEVMHASDSGRKTSAAGLNEATGGLAVCFCMEVRDSLPDFLHGCCLTPEASSAFMRCRSDLLVAGADLGGRVDRGR